MAESLDLFLLCISSLIVMTPCSVSWRQLCCVGDRGGARFKRALYVVSWVTLAVPLNVMVYVANIYYPTFDLLYWTYLLEAFIVVLGMHNFQSLAFAFVDNIIYQNGRPTCITVIIYLIVMFVDTLTLCLYGRGLFTSEV